MKTRLLLYLFFISVTLANAQQSFEGKIKFKTDITFPSTASAASQEKVLKKYGDSLTIFYSKEGNYKREYHNTGESGNASQVFIASKGMVYQLMKKSGRIDSVSVAKNGLILETKTKIDPQQIMGISCDCYQYSGKDKVGGIVQITYCFSAKSPVIDAKLFKNHESFFFKDFFETAKRPFLKYEMRSNSFTITYTATELVEMPVADSVFQLTLTAKK